MPIPSLNLTQTEKPESDLAGLLKDGDEKPKDMDWDATELKMRAAVETIEAQIEMLQEQKRKLLQKLGESPEGDTRGTVDVEDGE